MWMSSPMPMVTMVKTLDVSRLMKVSKKNGLKFTMLMCWCIGKAVDQVEEFYTLPEDGKLYRYDKLAINVIVENSKGGISSCDIPFSDDMQQFNRDYLMFTMLTSWCIGKAAGQVEEFKTLPVDGKLYHYDKLAVNVIVENSKGGISSCDIPFSDDLQQFNHDYLSLTAQAANECKSSFLDGIWL